MLAHRLGIARTPAIVDANILPDRPTRLLQGLCESRQPGVPFRIVRGIRREDADAPHRAGLLLRPRRERPRRCRAAERDQQFPPSDGDCHTPLPCEVRRETIPRRERAVLPFKEGRMLAPPPRWSANCTIPAPALGERRHRRLARRLELWCTAAS